jgi:hypothetical protein
MYIEIETELVEGLCVDESKVIAFSVKNRQRITGENTDYAVV